MEQGCPELATYRGRCQAHARKKDRTRKGPRIYSKRKWTMTRRTVLNAEPFCRIHLEKEGKEVLATEVDHIVPLALGGSAYSLANLQPLCHSCHSVKTRKEQATT